MLKGLMIILFSSVLVNNYVLNRFLGICPFLGASKKFDQASGMGIAVTAVMLIATAVTWPIQRFVLDRFDLALGEGDLTGHISVVAVRGGFVLAGGESQVKPLGDFSTGSER